MAFKGLTSSLLLVLLVVSLSKADDTDADDEPSSPLDFFSKIGTKVTKKIEEAVIKAKADHAKTEEEKIEDEYVKGHKGEWAEIQNSMKDLVKEPEKNPPTSRALECLDDSGKYCFEKFENLGYWHDRIPDKIDTINAKFRLYTPSSKNVSTNMFPNDPDYLKLLPADFDPALPFKVIIHGFSETATGPAPIGSRWMHDMKDEFFIFHDGKCNVVLVDWKDGAAAPNYGRAVANTRLVGRQIGMLVDDLETKFSTDLATRSHIIGFSLGAQIAGNAGMYVAKKKAEDRAIVGACKKVHRVTGLDPAGPAFGFPFLVDASLRLDKTDGCYVDAIHSNAITSLIGYGCGIEQAVGHDDFYPNGGSQQPGCNSIIENGIKHAVRGNEDGETVACNHIRAVEYFIETINSQKKANSYECEDFETFENGMCMDKGQSQLGYDWKEQNKAERTTFTKTNNMDPYIGNLLEIKAKFSASSAVSKKWWNPYATSVYGDIEITLIDNAGQEEVVTIEDKYISANTDTNTEVVNVAAAPKNFDLKQLKQIKVKYTTGSYIDYTQNNFAAKYEVKVIDVDSGLTKVIASKPNSLLVSEKAKVYNV